MEIGFSDGWFYRLPLYAAFGILAEFFFTALADLIHAPPVPVAFASIQPSASLPPYCRNVRGLGYSTLWMVPIYGSLILIEPVQQLLQDFPWYARGCFYVAGLWAIEYFSGWLIRRLGAICPWDYSDAPLQVRGLIRLDYFPFWFAFTLLTEAFSRKLIALTPAIQNLF